MVARAATKRLTPRRYDHPRVAGRAPLPRGRAGSRRGSPAARLRSHRRHRGTPRAPQPCIPPAVLMAGSNRMALRMSNANRKEPACQIRPVPLTRQVVPHHLHTSQLLIATYRKSNIHSLFSIHYRSSFKLGSQMNRLKQVMR